MKIFLTAIFLVINLASLCTARPQQNYSKKPFNWFAWSKCPKTYWNYNINQCMDYPENHPSHYTTNFIGYKSNDPVSNAKMNGQNTKIWPVAKNNNKAIDPCRGWFYKMNNQRKCNPSYYPVNHPSYYGKEILGMRTNRPAARYPYGVAVGQRFGYFG